MDNLKQYLQQHKEAMDVDEPAPELWDQINRPVPQNRPARVKNVVFRFAAAAVLLTAIVITGIKLSNSGKEKVIAVKKDTPVASPVKQPSDSSSPVIAKVEPSTKKDSIPATAHKNNSKTKPVDERYAMMRSFKENYGQLVSYQLSAIRSTAVYAEDPGYFDDFKIRLKQMDMDEMVIRKTIRQKGISNNLLEQLINIYQQKSDVLKSLLAEINKMNERVKLQPDTTNKYYLNI
jgi:hypothetical protein